jgi:hypothetical protein
MPQHWSLRFTRVPQHCFFTRSSRVGVNVRDIFDRPNEELHYPCQIYLSLCQCCTSISTFGTGSGLSSSGPLWLTASYGAGPDGAYSASSSYRSFFLGMSSLLGAWEVWRASAPPKVKFFFWLALHRRLWTADCKRRHGLQDSAECALYGQEDETVDHLFASCVFAREVWFRVLHPSGWDPLSPTAHSPLSTWWPDGRSTVPAQLRRGFDSAVLLVSWRLWKERNSRTFDGSSSTVQ